MLPSLPICQHCTDQLSAHCDGRYQTSAWGRDLSLDHHSSTRMDICQWICVVLGHEPYKIYFNPTCNWMGFDEQSIFFSLSLTRPTALSAKPFLAGWYGGVRRCLIPYLVILSLNSFDTSWDPLSLTRVVGNPVSSQNHPYRTANVFSVVVSWFIMLVQIFLH